MNNGYGKVDATGYDFSKSTQQTITGLYAQIEQAVKTGKVILLHGWNYDGKPLTPMFVYVMKSTNDYVIDGKIKVTSADKVAPLS